MRKLKSRKNTKGCVIAINYQINMSLKMASSYNNYIEISVFHCISMTSKNGVNFYFIEKNISTQKFNCVITKINVVFIIVQRLLLTRMNYDIRLRFVAHTHFYRRSRSRNNMLYI